MFAETFCSLLKAFATAPKLSMSKEDIEKCWIKLRDNPFPPHCCKYQKRSANFGFDKWSRIYSDYSIPSLSWGVPH